MPVSSIMGRKSKIIKHIFVLVSHRINDHIVFLFLCFEKASFFKRCHMTQSMVLLQSTKWVGCKLSLSASLQNFTQTPKYNVPFQ